MPRKSKKQSQYEELSQYKADFLADFRADSAWRKNATEDAEFYDGNQLTNEEKEVLKQRGQPAVVINRIKPKLDAIFGMQTAMRVDTKAFPTGDREQEAEFVSEYFRSIEDDNDFDDAESLAFEDQCIQGRGWYRLGKQWDGLKSRHQVKRAFPEDVVPDRYCRLSDLSDAKRIHETVMMDLDDAKALFPSYADKLDAAVGEGFQGDDMDAEEHYRVRPDQYKSGVLPMDNRDYQDFVDPKQKRVRVVTTYYRTLEPLKLYFHPALPEPMDLSEMDSKGLETLKLTYPEGQEVSQWVKKLHACTFCWNTKLEHKTDIRPYDQDAKFPFVLVPGYVERATSVHYGLVKQMKDPQREVNKRRSKLLHILNVNQVRAQKGAFDDPQNARAEFAKPDGFIEINPGFEVEVDKNLDLSQAHFMLLQQATKEIDDSGVRSEIEGKATGSSSGREFQLRQQQASQGIRKLVSNLRAARRRVALYFLDEFLKEHPDLALTKYDVLVEEAPDSLTLTSETFDQLVALANNGLPIPPDMLIEVSPLPSNVKAKFLERMQQQMAMQAQLAAMGNAGTQSAPPAPTGV